MQTSKLLVVLVLIAALCFSVADAKRAKRRVGGCRIFRTRKGRVVKQCRLSRTRVSRRTCTVIRRVGRRATVCCRGGKRTVKVVRRRRVIRRKRVIKRRRVIRKRRVIRRKRVIRRRRNIRRRRVIRRKRVIRRRRVIKRRRSPFRGPKKCPTGFVLRFKKLGARKWRRRCARVKVQTAPAQVCHTWGDPHFKTLQGQNFDNYQQGDFDFVRSTDGIFAIQVRQGYAQAWGKNAVNQRVAIKVNGVDVISLNVRKGLIKRNHKKFDLAVNKVKNFKNGGAIKRIGTHRFEVVTPTGIRTLVDWVIVNDKSYYANIYTYATADWAKKLKGFCTSKVVRKVKKSFFIKKFHKRRVPKTRKWTRRLRVRAGRFCRKFRGSFKKQCLRDYRVGGRKLAGAARHVAGDIRKLKKRRSWIRRAARAIGRAFRR